jgi:chemotaxis protein CheX
MATVALDDMDQIGGIDRAVAEVFEGMLRLSCASVAGQPVPAMQIAAKILFSGTLEGDCTIQMPVEAAERLTDALLGSQCAWDDEMLDDAVGELCNMIAGRWKSSLGAAARCHLSVPTVSRGASGAACEVGGVSLRRFYGFDGAVFELRLRLACDAGQRKD